MSRASELARIQAEIDRLQAELVGKIAVRDYLQGQQSPATTGGGRNGSLTLTQAAEETLRRRGPMRHRDLARELDANTHTLAKALAARPDTFMHPERGFWALTQ